MAFKRAVLPAAEPQDAEALTAAMAGIGMGFAVVPALDPNIEDTLLRASVEAIERHDLRTLDLLVAWFEIHAEWVNADRLTRLAAAQAPRVQAVWSALAGRAAANRRFARLAAAYRGAKVDVLPVGTAFQVARHGEDPRFAGGPLRVPGNLLRRRPADVESPAGLARRHRTYRYRVLIGPSYRADMWAALEAEPALSAASLARRTYGSFATAWRVRRDFALLAAPVAEARGAIAPAGAGATARATAKKAAPSRPLPARR